MGVYMRNARNFGAHIYTNAKYLETEIDKSTDELIRTLMNVRASKGVNVKIPALIDAAERFGLATDSFERIEGEWHCKSLESLRVFLGMLVQVTEQAEKAVSKCFLLEVPAELRVEIYECLAALHKSTSLFISQGRYKGEPLKSAIMQVNRRIRKESTPIMYRGSHIIVSTGSEEDRRNALTWLNGPGNDEIVESISTFILRPCSNCNRKVIVDLVRLGAPTVFGIPHSSPAYRCVNHDKSAITACANIVRSHLEALETTRYNHWVVTKDVMESLINEVSDCMARMDSAYGSHADPYWDLDYEA